MSTKEEQKQHLIDIMKADEELGLYELGQEVGHSVQVERLEESADLWSIDTNNVHPADSYIAKTSFIEGAKWMQKQMYSEEEVLKILVSHGNFLYNGEELTLSDWFEQFKKHRL